eukprot:m.479443 g.479443  ORF g.479443 m.479443 type:complete len:128 (-) comp21700_c0_seq16:168-551(-)
MGSAFGIFLNIQRSRMGLRDGTVRCGRATTQALGYETSDACKAMPWTWRVRWCKQLEGVRHASGDVQLHWYSRGLHSCIEPFDLAEQDLFALFAAILISLLHTYTSMSISLQSQVYFSVYDRHATDR